jgi:hypothetical protein
VAALTRKAYWIYVYTAVDVKGRTAKGPLRINNPSVRLEKLGFTVQPMDVYVSRGSAL